MAWNEPGSGKQRDPWRDNGGGGPSPDLEALLKRLRESFNRLFGGGGGFGVAVVGILIAWVVFDSVVRVDASDTGVVLRFGQFSRILQPGPNFKLPWPIESVVKVNATQIKTFSSNVPVLTRDENIVNVALNVQYRVDDPRLYQFGTIDADQVLEQSAQSAVREQVGRADLNTVLNNRGPLAVAAEQRLEASLKAYRTGLVVTGLTLPDARPPEEVKPAFDEVNGAQQVKERLINEAQAYANDVVPRASGAASRLQEEAAGYKARVVAQAQGDAQRFNSVVAEYQKAPQVTRDRMYLDTMQHVLSDVTKVLVESRQGSSLMYLPLDKLLSDTLQAPAGAPAGVSAASRVAAPAAPASSPPPVAGDARSRDNARSREREPR